MTLNFKRPEELAVATRLDRSADVVIENFRPGVMERLGLGRQTARRLKPGLLDCSLPGFASDDPRAQVRAFEGVVGAATATYRPPTRDDDWPVYTAIPIVSIMPPFRPRLVSLSRCLRASAMASGSASKYPCSMPPSLPSAPGPCESTTSPIVPTPRGIWNGAFQCADGRWVQFGGSGNQNFRYFVEAAGITAWDQEGLTDIERIMSDPTLFAKHLRRARALFKTRTAQAWEDWWPGPAVSAPCVEPAQNGSASPCPGLADGAGSRRSQVWQDAATRHQCSPVPHPGRRAGRRQADQHRAEILADSRRHTRRTAPAARYHHKRGARLCTGAGLPYHPGRPDVGRTLAEFGADVIKIDNPMRGGFVSSHNDVNRG